MPILFRLLAGLIGLSYPFAVYAGLRHVGAGVFGYVLFSLLVIRLLLVPGSISRGRLAAFAALATYSLAIAVLGDPLLLRLYPMVVSAGMSLVFLASLRRPPPLLEQVAREFGQEVPDHAIAYLRVLTGIWGILLGLNALVSAYTALFLDLRQWTLYNGLIAYLLFAGVFILEYPLRLLYRRRYRDGAAAAEQFPS